VWLALTERICQDAGAARVRVTAAVGVNALRSGYGHTYVQRKANEECAIEAAIVAQELEINLDARGRLARNPDFRLTSTILNDQWRTAGCKRFPLYRVRRARFLCCTRSTVISSPQCGLHLTCVHSGVRFGRFGRGGAMAIQKNGAVGALSLEPNVVRRLRVMSLDVRDHMGTRSSGPRRRYPPANHVP
jgi:hypothetical protein